MPTAPIISVITIAWNSERTIERALRSVAAQEGVPPGVLEHWVIDGASKDGTLERVKAFPSVKVLSEKDHGISDAFSKGVHVSKGKWILFLNSDDELADRFVIRDFLHLLDDSLDFVYGTLTVIGADGNPVRSAGKDRAWTHLHQRMTIPHPATFSNRRYFEKYGTFDRNFRCAMDYEWFLRGFRDAKFKHIPRAVNRFYEGGISTGSGGFKQALECYRAKRKNGVGSAMSRLFWLVYQGLRMQFEPLLLRIPGVGSVVRKLATAVGRGY